MEAKRSLQELIESTRTFCKEDTAKSHRLFWSTLLIAGLFFWFATHTSFWPVSLCFSILAGLTMVRLFIFYHDYMHDAIFRDSRFMEGVMSVLGLLLLNPPNVWKRSHNYHHQKNAQIATASIGSFPVLTVSQYESATPVQRFAYRMIRSPLNMVFGYITIFIIGMCLRSFFTDKKRHADSLVALALHAVIAILVYKLGSLSALMFGVLIPFSLAHALGAYLFYTQHNFPGVQLRPRTEWDYGFAALYSSSYMEGGKFVRWFTGNIGYHHVHHLNARIPFYRLPEAMAAIPELQHPMRTSLKPMDIVRALRLKLWNPDLGEMVGFPPLLTSAKVSLPSKA